MLVRAPTREVRDWFCDSRQWDRYHPRADDIVIATAARVGTTWTQQIVSLLVFQSAEPRDIMAVSPWIDCRFMMPIEAMAPMVAAQPHRSILKSHLPADALPIYDEMRYIHVARGGLDACMSQFNFMNGFSRDQLAAFDALGLADDVIGRSFPRTPTAVREFFRWWVDEAGEDFCMSANGIFSLERSFWAERERPNVLLVHYNDLKADLSGEMGRIADFLGIETPAALWPKLVEAATFETMKKNGAALLAQVEGRFKDGHKTFLHQGTNNRWQGVLTDEDVALYRHRVASELPADLGEWLERGRLGSRA